MAFHVQHIYFIFTFYGLMHFKIGKYTRVSERASERELCFRCDGTSDVTYCNRPCCIAWSMIMKSFLEWHEQRQRPTHEWQSPKRKTEKKNTQYSLLACEMLLECSCYWVKTINVHPYRRPDKTFALFRKSSKNGLTHQHRWGVYWGVHGMHCRGPRRKQVTKITDNQSKLRHFTENASILNAFGVATHTHT